VDRYVVHSPNRRAVQDGHGPEHEVRDDRDARLDSFVQLVAGWIQRHGPRFDLENTISGVEPQVILDRVPDLRLCVDTGHLLLQGRSPAAAVASGGIHLRSIHLHGVENGRDHKVFDNTERWFVELVETVSSRHREPVTVHLELFDIEKVRTVLPSVVEAFSLMRVSHE
jgi:sugar phosphate isomerase/epimerase